MIDTIKLAEIISSLNTPLFCNKSSYSENNAIQDLEGRTHYVDKGTLRYFNARVTGGADHCSGTVFCLIESLPDSKNKRGFRFVVFDVWGTVLNEREFFTSSQKARNGFYTWLGEYDLLAHYREAFATRATRAKREHDELRAAFNATFEGAV